MFLTSGKTRSSVIIGLDLYEFSWINYTGRKIRSSSFILAYSNWENRDICYSETFESLSRGFQNALFELQAIPEDHRIDNLSAATCKID